MIIVCYVLRFAVTFWLYQGLGSVVTFSRSAHFRASFFLDIPQEGRFFRELNHVWYMGKGRTNGRRMSVMHQILMMTRMII